MKHLYLDTLRVENFQKFQCKTFSFFDHTVVTGENRAGKTTIQSAMLWLLFGKDTYNQTDTGRGAFDIKRRVDGETIPHTDVTVEGIFTLLDGASREVIRLKRVLHECWTKKNVYTGDETQCFINDVPYKIGQYQDYISSIIDEDEFRMISSVGYFNSLKTDYKRAYLCSMAGVQSVEDIVAQSKNNDWKEFIKEISGKKLEDMLKQITFERKKVKDEYATIDPKIQSLQKVMPEELDWFDLDEQLCAKRKELDIINESIKGSNDAYSLVKEKVSELRAKASQKRKEFYEATQAIEDAKRNALTKAKDALYKKDEELRKKKAELKELQDKRTNLYLSRNTNQLRVEKYTKEMAELMQKYNNEQETVFQEDNGTYTCPLMAGRVCDSASLRAFMADNQEKARAEFNVKKQEKLESIMAEGRAIKAQKTESEKKLEEIAASINTTERAIEALDAVIGSTPEYSNQPIDESTLVIEGIEELKSKRQAANGEITKLEEEANKLEGSLSNPDASAEENVQKKATLSAEIEKLIRTLASREQIDKINNEIESLENRAKELAKQIVEYDNRETIIRDINRAVVDDATERVNKLFSITTWQLFEQQKNGLYAEVCKPTINGVSNSLNSEARINIGIDICNAISTFVGMSAPLFIDNAESVNELLPTVGQSIKMYVAPKGTELTLSHN